MRTRYAIVKNAQTRKQAEAYLPGNYEVIDEYAESYKYGSARPVFLIAGTDSHGWTLDEYVIPRYASGLIWAVECDSPDLFLADKAAAARKATAA